MKKTGKRLLAAMLLFCTILIGAAGYEVMAADEAQSTESTSGTVNSADDLPGKRIGVQLGTTILTNILRCSPLQVQQVRCVMVLALII